MALTDFLSIDSYLLFSRSFNFYIIKICIRNASNLFIDTDVLIPYEKNNNKIDRFSMFCVFGGYYPPERELKDFS